MGGRQPTSSRRPGDWCACGKNRSNKLFSIGQFSRRTLLIGSTFNYFWCFLLLFCSSSSSLKPQGFPNLPNLCYISRAKTVNFLTRCFPPAQAESGDPGPVMWSWRERGERSVITRTPGDNNVTSWQPLVTRGSHSHSVMVTVTMTEITLSRTVTSPRMLRWSWLSGDQDVFTPTRQQVSRPPDPSGMCLSGRWPLWVFDTC